MKSLIRRILKYIIIGELCYLIVINIALNLPQTQTLLNRIDPEIFIVTWDRAWSFYPFRVHAEMVLTNGQADDLQWQAKASSANASISLLALFSNRVELINVDGTNLAYYQRPLPESDSDYSEIRAYFPPIKDRVLENVVIQPTDKNSDPEEEKDANWHISITDIRANGSHELWIYQVQTTFDGSLKSDLSIDTEGAFSLSNGSADVDIQSFSLSGDQKIIQNGSVKGAVAILPYDSDLDGESDFLNFLDIDARLEVETENLHFLNVYLDNFEGMQIDGTGLVKGRVRLIEGELLPGSDIEITAPLLSLNMFGKHLKGDGHISIKADDDKAVTEAIILFDTIEAYDTNGKALLFRGNGVNVKGQANRSVLTDGEHPFEAKQLLLTIPAATVPNLATYQPYIPQKLALHLYGGEGRLQGFVKLTEHGVESELELSSQSADVGFKEYRFRSDLKAKLDINSPKIASGIDVSGTYIYLKNAQLTAGKQQGEKLLNASIHIDKGKMHLLLPEKISKNASFAELYEALKEKDLLSMLDSGDKDIQATASISDLTWLSLLLPNTYGLSISGAGAVEANVFLSRGWFGKGTRLAITPQQLKVDVLEYTVAGNGEVTLLVQKGGEQPDMLLNITLNDALMRRQDEQQAFIEDVSISLRALARKVTLNDQPQDMDLHLLLSSAKVSDMSVYNQYLPTDSPLQFIAGEAELSSDITMTPKSAVGYVTLQTKGLSARVDKQDVDGELLVNVKLTGGIPENMDFDISGSSFSLFDVKVIGADAQYEDEKWNARFDLTKGQAVWKQPVSMNFEAGLHMTNSKPIVAMLANQRGENGWLERALTIDDVSGTATVAVDQGNIIIPYAFVSSEKIDVGAKGVITDADRDGVFYVRFRIFDAILKMHNGERNLDVWGAKEQFEEYNSAKVLKRLLHPAKDTKTVPLQVETEEWQE